MPSVIHTLSTYYHTKSASRNTTTTQMFMYVVSKHKNADKLFRLKRHDRNQLVL